MSRFSHIQTMMSPALTFKEDLLEVMDEMQKEDASAAPVLLNLWLRVCKKGRERQAKAQEIPPVIGLADDLPF